MSTEVISPAPASSKDDEALKTIRDELKTLQISRRGFRQRLMRFQRSHKYVSKHLPEKSKDSSEDGQKASVRHAYQLLRSFCSTYNSLQNVEVADRFKVPADFESELKEVLTDNYFANFSDAIQATKEEFEAKLPKTVTSDVCERLLKFVSVKEKDHIISKYEAKIDEITTQVDAKVAERNAIKPPAAPRAPRAPREKSNPSNKRQRSRRNSGDSSQSASLEDRLTDILKEVSKRTDSVQFSKDDFESLSEAQSQLDALLRETVTEILKMKQRLRKRFAGAQSSRRKTSNSRSRSQSNSRRRN